jgi:hypothetical protein
MSKSRHVFKTCTIIVKQKNGYDIWISTELGDTLYEELKCQCREEYDCEVVRSPSCRIEGVSKSGRIQIFHL